MDSGTKRNGSSEADPDVPAKLAEQRLERGEEAEALPGRQVVREHDLLQLGIAQGVEIEVARQVALKSTTTGRSASSTSASKWASSVLVTMGLLAERGTGSLSHPHAVRSKSNP